MKNSLFLLFIFIISCSSAKQDVPVTVLNQEILPHPRLLFLKTSELVVKEQIQTIPLAKEIYARLMEEADSLLSVPLQEHTLHEGYIQNILSVSREEISRIITLSLAYRMTEDIRYLEKAEKELVNVCNFPDWNPRHYLDVAEMTTAVAIGYDWLYYNLKDETKKLIVESIKTKALDFVVKEYAEGNSESWAKRETNWNVVCNTGMVVGAMAIAEYYPELTGQIIQNAVKYIPNCLKHYVPDGVCYEGPAYWGYTNIYLSLLLSVLNQNFNQDYGISDLEGVSETVLYYIHSTSPSGKIFNFANSSGTSADSSPIYFFFSHHFNQPEAADFYRKILSDRLKNKKKIDRFFFLSLPWFDNSVYVADNKLPKLNVYRGINDIAVFKENENIPHSIYLIAKGGDPDKAHQQLDVGTFIVETDSVRWSDDLGADSYDLPGFWDYKPNGQRWNYFRNTNFSHNTLIIDGKIQYSAGTGKVVEYDNKSFEPYFTIDMSSAYTGQVSSVLRTFTFTNDSTVTLVDKVKLLSSSQEITWNMITSAEIECNKKEAKLFKDGKTFYLRILSPENAFFSVKPAKTFTEKENLLTGYQLLQIPVSGKENMEIKVVMGKIK